MNLNGISKSGFMISLLVFLAGCGGSDGGGSADPNEAFTNAITFGGGTLKSGTPPPATNNPGDPYLVTPTTTDTVSPTTGSGTMNVSFNNIPPGTTGNVNIRFGNNSSSYFSVPVTNTGSTSSGTFALPFSLSSSVCDNLDDIQHQIQCYESVDIGGVQISTEQARQLVLNCQQNPGSDPSQIGGAGSFCAYNYPQDACTEIQNIYSGDPNTTVLFVPGTGSSTCNAYPNVQDTYDYGYLDTYLGQPGACILGFTY